MDRHCWCTAGAGARAMATVVGVRVPPSPTSHMQPAAVPPRVWPRRRSDMYTPSHASNRWQAPAQDMREVSRAPRVARPRHGWEITEAEVVEQNSAGAAGAPPPPPAMGSPRRASLLARPTWPMFPSKGLATCELCCFCFQVLRAHLQSRPPPPFPQTVDPLFKAPLFVTWLKGRQSEYGDPGEPELRGCIGCLEPIEFRPGLSEYALRSSLQDKRFPPVRLDEVPLLTCKLSILYQFEQCAHIHDWQVGLHGVLINFTDSHGRHYSATYLPEVAREHGMTHDRAIRELVAKASYSGPCDEDLLSCMKITRYQTLVESMTHKEFLSSGSAEPFRREVGSPW